MIETTHVMLIFGFHVTTYKGHINIKVGFCTPTPCQKSLFLADFWLPICQKSRSHHQISQNLNLNMRNSRGDSQVAKNTIKSGLVAGHRGRFDILVDFRTDFPYVRLHFLRHTRYNSKFYGTKYRWAD